YFNSRGVLLERWIKKTFEKEDGKGLADHFLSNPLLDGLSENKKAASYMKAKDFASAVLQLFQKNAVDTDFSQLAGLNMPDKTKEALQMLIKKAELEAASPNKADVEKQFLLLVADWFDSMMDRVGGKYRKKALWSNLFIATAVTLVANIDTISIIRYLNTNKEAASRLAEAAYKASTDSTYQNAVAKIANTNELSDTVNTDMDDVMAAQAVVKANQTIETEINKIKEINTQLGSYLPIGWGNGEFSAFVKKHYPGNQNFWQESKWKGAFLFGLSKLPGWLMTILAAMLGAPFWYELLNKVANIRNSIKPLTAKKEEQKA
ncbi:MAG TPA: hypothetical protein PKY12_10220, partial [Catalimonadaceae bacterium]|nr:hypothetical protein [Catalimonadaceae bacterium]